MGLEEQEFWNFTWAQLDALSEQHAEKEERQDYRSALICAVIANVNRDPKKQKAFQPSDFMPQRKPNKPPDPAELWSEIQLWNAALGGVEVKKDVR